MKETLFDISPGLKIDGTEYLYHYTSWKTAKEFILGGNQTIRFGSVDDMNDPLEFQGIKVPLYGAWSEKVISRIFKQIETANRDGVRLFCGSRDIPAKKIRKPAHLQHLKTEFLQTEAVRGFTHAPMWYHYGDKHEGVCIIFSKNKLHDAILKSYGNKGKLMSDNTIYSNVGIEFSKLGGKFKPIDGMESWTDEQLNQYVVDVMYQNKKPFFFTKHPSWAYENEFRWVYKSQDSEITYIPIENSIAGLILGSDFNALEHDEVRELCKNLDIPVRRIWWNNGSASPLWDLEAFEGSYDMGTHLESKAKGRRERRKQNSISIWETIKNAIQQWLL